MTNSYCGSAEVKYANKHKDLIEKALYGATAWHKVRDRIYEKTKKDLKLIEKDMPFSIKKASKLLHEQFVKFMDVRDLDEKTHMNIGYMYADKNESESDEASYDDEEDSDGE